MISLLYCGNAKVFQGLLLSLTSVLMRVHQPVDVHICTMDWTKKDPAYTPITADQAAFLERIAQAAQPGSRVELHDVGALFVETLSDSPNATSVYTPYTLLRLLIDQLSLPDRVLYIDTDTVAMADLAPLFEMDLTGFEFAAVKDYLGRVFIHPRYMNAGVVLFNMPQLRRTGLMVRSRALCNEQKFHFPDQDVLNHCVQRRRFLPRRFNEQRKLHANTVIRHFSKTIRWLPWFHTLNIKPWDEEGLHNVLKTHAYDDVLEVYHKNLALWRDNNDTQ